MSYSSSYDTSVLTTWLNKKFISDLMYELQHVQFTEKAIIPAQSGKIGRFITWTQPVAATTWLTEGTDSEQEVSFSGIGTDITIVEWGQHLKTTELMMYAAVKGAREKLSKKLRDSAALTIDSWVRDAAAATTSAAYCGDTQAGATTAAPANVTAGNAAALIFAKKVLKSNLATGFEGVPGHPNREFAAILSETYEQQMVQEVSSGRITWAAINKEVGGKIGQEKLVKGYLGSVYGVACYVTNNASQTALTSTADDNYVMADGGVGAMSFRDMKPRIILNDVNSPYKNIDSIAWHAFFNATLIESVRVIKLYSNSEA